MIKKMLAITTSVAISAMLLGACSSSKNAGTANRDNIKGNWRLDKITYENQPQSPVKISLLDEGSEKCLEGSTWVLPNNGYGSYTIASNSAGCTGGVRNIVWSKRDEAGQSYLQFKKLPGGVKAEDIADGYRFKIVSADGSSLHLLSETNFEGKAMAIHYNFTKQ